MTSRKDASGAAPFQSVAIIGLGVMGGSLARALKGAPTPPRIIGYSTNERDREEALARGAVDETPSDSESAAASAELVVYAVPLSAILDLQTRHQSVWKPDAVVSDLSSLKVPVTTQARALGVESRWVSAHPMAGAERSGFSASRDGLFRDAVVWLSAPDAPADVCARVERFWRALGARPAWTDPATHDERMVRASHLPQLLANALARDLEQHGIARAELGSGGHDMTRLAASSPSMWRDLLEHSARDVAPALREVAAELERLADLLEARDLDAVSALMTRTRAWTSQPEGGGPEAHGERSGGARRAAGPETHA